MGKLGMKCEVHLLSIEYYGGFSFSSFFAFWYWKKIKTNIVSNKLPLNVFHASITLTMSNWNWFVISSRRVSIKIPGTRIQDLGSLTILYNNTVLLSVFRSEERYRALTCNIVQSYCVYDLPVHWDLSSRFDVGPCPNIVIEYCAVISWTYNHLKMSTFAFASSILLLSVLLVGECFFKSASAYNYP